MRVSEPQKASVWRTVKFSSGQGQQVLYQGEHVQGQTLTLPLVMNCVNGTIFFEPHLTVSDSWTFWVI